MYKKGFTLAEVLITLGIIGVVAAITLPTLIQNYQKQVYANGAKKGLNTVMNLMSKIQEDENASSLETTTLFSDGTCYMEPTCEERYGNPTVIENLIPKYVKTIKTCKNEECDIKYIGSNFVNNKLHLNQDYVENIYNYNSNWSTIYGFYLEDGMVLYIFPSQIGISIYFDINGEKGPNTNGYDLFFVSFSRTTGKVSYSPSANYDPDNTYNNQATSYPYNPLYYLMSNGWKMDY